MSDAAKRLVYKVCSEHEWREAVRLGSYLGSAVDLRDGFIHLSTDDQLAETLRRHFAGRHDLVLVAVDPADLGDALKWEPSRGGDAFPHLYSALAVSLACCVSPVQLGGHHGGGILRRAWLRLRSDWR